MYLEEKHLAHYGILRKSGRYPWGSSSNASTRNRDFLSYIENLRTNLGYSETKIAATIGISTTDLRAAKTVARAEQKQSAISQAQRLKDKGLGNVAIGKRMGLNESSVRALLKPGLIDKTNIIDNVSDALKQQMLTKPYLDVGTGAELSLGISETKLKAAVAKLKDEGYVVHPVKVQQLTNTSKFTTYKVLCPPGTTWVQAQRNKLNIQQIRGNFTDDGGRTMFGILPPMSFDSSRLGIAYRDMGGKDADGVIYVRPGIDDISIGGSMYAQVRIKVDQTHYIKGMAMYKSDLPEGVDLLFNTNKLDTGNKLDALKSLKEDKDNEFGTLIERQITTKNAKGEDVITSVMNLVREEGRWAKWNNSISPQVLSKQSPKLAKSQLDLTYDTKQKELNEILSLTNPVVKQKLLLLFAKSCDNVSVHLKAASLPRQSTHVILPLKTLKDNEVYAPNYLNGETVVLFRFPHAGLFEIPQLIVNNSNREGLRNLGKARDAIGINPTVAQKLSGADFDGDTVLVIPNNAGKIRFQPSLKELVDFDPGATFPGYPGMKPMSASGTQQEMGRASNLINDMTLKGAPNVELARAVRHSMVVIDAEKHKLNYKESFIVNGIKDLQIKYQPEGGSSTLISRAKSPGYVLERKERKMSEGGSIDKVTGEKVYVDTGRISWRTGEPVKTRLRKLDVETDAFKLSSGTPMETLYALQSNRLKALANSARLASLDTQNIKWSESAKKIYANEVKSLDSKLYLAVKNRPLERQAQIIANANVSQKRQANPNMSKADVKKIKQQALEQARAMTGAKRNQIEITKSEWEAIQQGAISTTKLKAILEEADNDVVKELATPRSIKEVSASKINRAKTMIGSNYTRAEVAAALGISIKSLDSVLNDDVNDDEDDEN